MVFQLDTRIPLGFTGGYDPAVGQRNALMRLQREALEAEAGETNALRDVLRQYGPGLNAESLDERQAAAAALAGVGPRGYQMAAPVMAGIRNQREIAGIMGGGAAPAPAAPQSGAVRAEALPPPGGYMARLVGMESGGNPTARNPRSTATGATQFIEGTWREFAQANPELFQGMSPQQVLDARNDPALSMRAAEWYRDRNTRFLSGLGLRADDTAAALAHRFGPQGAASLLRAQPDAPIASVVGQQVMAANPDLAGRSVADVIGQYERRFGGGAATPASAPAPGGAMPAASGPRMPGQPTPAQFAALVAAASGGNEAAARMVQAWAPFMRQENASEPLETVEGEGGRPVLVPRSQAVGRTPVRVPNTVVNNNPGEGSFDRERGKTLAEEEAETRNAGTRARQTLGRLDTIERSLERFRTGVTSETRVRAGQLAAQLGVPAAVLQSLGIDENTVAAGEQINSVASQMLVGMIGSGGFPAQAFSNADREMLQRALPSLSNSREGNRAIIGVMRAAAQRQIEISEAWAQWRRQNGASAESFDRFQLERLPQIVGQDVLAPLLQDAVPANDPGADQPRPAGVQAEPPAIPAVPRGVPQGSAYSPSRRMWRAPDGRMFNADGTPAR